MAKFICTLLLCVGLVVTGEADAAAIVKLYGSKITVYKDHRGTKRLEVIKKTDVALPAAQLSKMSPKGLIQIAIPFKDKNRKPLIGWVSKRHLKIDTNRTISIGSCRSISLANNNAAKSTHSSRGLGGGC